MLALIMKRKVSGVPRDQELVSRQELFDQYGKKVDRFESHRVSREGEDAIQKPGTCRTAINRAVEPVLREPESFSAGRPPRRRADDQNDRRRFGRRA